MTDTPTTPQATEYVVLAQAEGDSGAWIVSGSTVAASTAAAIRKHLDGVTDIDGVYVAVPARSWKPVSVKSRVALDFGSES